MNQKHHQEHQTQTIDRVLNKKQNLKFLWKYKFLLDYPSEIKFVIITEITCLLWAFYGPVDITNFEILVTKIIWQTKLFDRCLMTCSIFCLLCFFHVTVIQMLIKCSCLQGKGCKMSFFRIKQSLWGYFCFKIVLLKITNFGLLNY